MPATPFEQRYVAFVDILGFRGIVVRMANDPRLFKTIRDNLKTIDRQARMFRRYKKERAGKVSVLGPSRKSDFQMTAFSDCYVLSETWPAWHVLAAVQSLGARLLAEGILSRGGIVRGRAFHTGRVLFGPAVIEAYELERDVARY